VLSLPENIFRNRKGNVLFFHVFTCNT